MKKAILLALILGFACFTVSAQGFYFDIGIGFGQGTTKVDDMDASDFWKPEMELGLDMGLKLGYSPFNFPLYFAVDLSAIAMGFLLK